MRLYLNLIFFVLVCPCVTAYESGRAAFNLGVNDLIIPYRVFAIYALPGESLEMQAQGIDGEIIAFTIQDQIEISQTSSWTWITPDNPGVHELFVSSGDDHIQLNVVVMHPASMVVGGHLNGYRIGRYPARPLRGNPTYFPPLGFIELNEETATLQLSPHFQLSQFPSKQDGNRYPKYLVLREKLLLKLELLLEDVNRRGYGAETLTIMSGYRTPYYNAAIGNVQYSRHVYGGAADVYIDISPADGIMDDITGDSHSNYVDAQLLYKWANALYRMPEHSHLAGGLGVYRKTAAHGPFLHIDARGQRARWGVIP